LNCQLATVGGLTVLALFAHVFGGVRQSLSVGPAKLTDKEKLANFEILDRTRVQSMCAFQLVTVDLLALSTLLFLLAFTDVFVQKQLIGFLLSALYFLWGCSWLIQLFALRRKARDYLLLGHWTFWFGCSALIYWGSLSL
jgi:NADH:ubiquinone oxidoreductase subunit K